MKADLEQLRKDIAKGKPVPLGNIKEEEGEGERGDQVKEERSSIQIRLGGAGEESSEDSDDQPERLDDGEYCMIAWCACIRVTWRWKVYTVGPPSI